MIRCSVMLLALVTVSLAGCVTPEFPIKRSEAADAAKVRVVSNMPSGWLNLYPETDCNSGYNMQSDIPVDKLARSVMKIESPRAGMTHTPVVGADRYAEYAVAPGQVINIGASCLGGVSFIALPAQQYEVVVSGNGPNTCSISVQTLHIVEGIMARRAVRGLRPLVCASKLR